MKKSDFILTAAGVVLMGGFILSLLTSCEGPAGVAGNDANESCVQCHDNNTDILARTMQANNSGHQTGTSFERNDASCAPCHTHQGFLEVLATGAEATASKVSNPLPANCRTCHMIHENYDSTDFNLRTVAPVDLWMNGATVDLGGTGNICVTCHQPRTPDPMPELNGNNVTITSNRWGPHHGTQAAILYATAAYEVAGTESYPPEGGHTHAAAGCNACHMAEPFGAFAGGHTFSMSYEYHGTETEHLAGCMVCHPSATSFDIDGKETEVEEMLGQLRTKLVDKGWLVDGSGLVNASSSNPLTISANQAGALLNYYFVVEDGSMGIHNPDYTLALLKNSVGGH